LYGILFCGEGGTTSSVLDKAKEVADLAHTGKNENFQLLPDRHNWHDYGCKSHAVNK